VQCVVPENIHTLPMECFKLGPSPATPLEIPLKCHSFLQKFGLLKPPSPLEFLLTFLGVGMDIFWNYTIRLSCPEHKHAIKM